MPWFYQEVEKYVNLYRANLTFPDGFVGSFIEDINKTHVHTVNAEH